jgi:hypothetical protein
LFDKVGNSTCEKAFSVQIGKSTAPQSSIAFKAGTGVEAEELYFPFASILGFFL